MLSYINYHFSRLKNWFRLRLTKQGRKELYFQRALKPLKKKGDEIDARKAKVKGNALKTAGNILTPQKIITFGEGKSITKAKTTKHRLHKVVTEKHGEELQKEGITIDKQTLAFKG